MPKNSKNWTAVPQKPSFRTELRVMNTDLQNTQCWLVSDSVFENPTKMTTNPEMAMLFRAGLQIQTRHMNLKQWPCYRANVETNTKSFDEVVKFPYKFQTQGIHV